MRQHCKSGILFDFWRDDAQGLEMRTYYDVLGVAQTASNREIKRAYRKLVFKVHPDHNPDDTDAHALFQDLNAAYNILTDPEKRAEHDRLVFERSGSEPQPEDRPMSFRETFVYYALIVVLGGGTVLGLGFMLFLLFIVIYDLLN